MRQPFARPQVARGWASSWVMRIGATKSLNPGRARRRAIQVQSSRVLPLLQANTSWSPDRRRKSGTGSGEARGTQFRKARTSPKARTRVSEGRREPPMPHQSRRRFGSRAARSGSATVRQPPEMGRDGLPMRADVHLRLPWLEWWHRDRGRPWRAPPSRIRSSSPAAGPGARRQDLETG